MMINVQNIFTVIMEIQEALDDVEDEEFEAYRQTLVSYIIANGAVTSRFAPLKKELKPALFFIKDKALAMRVHSQRKPLVEETNPPKERA